MLPVTDHQPRHVQGLRAGFTCGDYQDEHGAYMDRLDEWAPLGGTRGKEYMKGSLCHYAFRTGYVYVSRTVPARREAFPVVDGMRYRVVFHACGDIEAKAIKPRARPLKRWSPAWRRVTDEGIRYLAYA